ncbi:MAG: hypothetical protein K0Q83_1753 [Deltaproteobacteria bacterium]|nr:hypothetical protein [Deltaproteobacteria bacterium]
MRTRPLVARVITSVYVLAALKRYLVTSILVCVTLIILAYGTLSVFFNSSRFELWLERELSIRTGYEITFGDIKFGLPFKITGAALTIAKSGHVITTAANLAMSVNPLDLLYKTIQRVTIERPVIHLELEEILKSPAQASSPLRIRHLEIRDGAVVLNTADGKRVEFSSINLRARDLNLGQSSGISLNADVPRLNAKAELFFNQQNEETKVDLVLRETSSERLVPFAGSDKVAKEMLRLEAKLTRTPNGTASLALIGKFNDLKIGPKPLTGGLDARVVPNPDFTEATVAARFEIADFANVVTEVSEGRQGAAVATLMGSYSAIDKLLSVTALKIATPLGAAHVQGSVSTGSDLVVNRAQLSINNVPWQVLKRFLPEPVNQWTYRGMAAAELTVNGPWKALQVTGAISSNKLDLHGGNFSLADIALHAPIDWTASSLKLKDVSLKGQSLVSGAKDRTQAGAEQVQINGSLAYTPQAPLVVNGRVQINGGRFASADGTKLGENLLLSGSVEVVSNTERHPMRVAGKLSLQRGEMLWGKFFADLGGQRPVLEFDGDYLRDDDSVRLRQARLTLASTGGIEVSGTINQLARAPSVEIQAHSDNLSAGGFFTFFVQENFKRQYPILDKLSIGGQIAFQLHARGNWDRLITEGRMTLQGGELRRGANEWEIGPLALTLPFQVSYPEKSNSVNRTPPGILSIRGGRFGSRSLEPITSAISLSNNTLIFHQPVRLVIFGGSVEITNLAWPDVVNDPKAMSFALDLRLLQLEELTDALGWPRFSGTLSGAIPQIRSTGDTLRSEGQVHADLFGGQLQIDQMEIENLFSTVPSLKLAARFQNIRLEQVSDTFAFGKISGILEGAVNDLVITEGQPARFQAQVETVDRPESSQWISVEALNKITILSSGQDSNVLYGGLAGLFDNFRYSKMGFRASLRNDRLTLRGVESRDGKEFLVVGTLLPPTVNIISHTQEIGFSELLRRLERITTEKPQVK